MYRISKTSAAIQVQYLTKNNKHSYRCTICLRLTICVCKPTYILQAGFVKHTASLYQVFSHLKNNPRPTLLSCSLQLEIRMLVFKVLELFPILRIHDRLLIWFQSFYAVFKIQTCKSLREMKIINTKHFLYTQQSHG